MANQQDLGIWKDRWDSLKGTMEALVTRYQDPPSPLPRKTTLHSLVRCLQAFAEDQFHFFHDGFGAHDHFILQTSEEYPLEHVLWVVLDQIAHDLEVIQRAAEQRLSGFATTLDKADKLAWQALQPVVGGSNLVEDGRTTVVTYFHKSPNIRVVPYAPVALIGIPFTCTDVPRDYLATPHEVGHYVFWRGRGVRAALRSSLPKERQYCHQWMEETFADVYGCLIAGAVIALDFQDLQLETSKKDFIEHDKAHPSPILRPYIYTKVLAEEGSQSRDWAKQLRRYWTVRRKKRVPEDEFVAANRQPVPIDDAISPEVGIPHSQGAVKPVDKAISAILERLPDLLQDRRRDCQDPERRSKCWPGEQPVFPELAHEDPSEQELEELAEKLYDHFQANLDTFLSQIESPPELKLAEAVSISGIMHLIPYSDLTVEQDGTTKLWKDWVVRERFFGGSPPPQSPVEIPSGTLEDLEAEPNSTWIHVLHASGWATKGPRSRN